MKIYGFTSLCILMACTHTAEAPPSALPQVEPDGRQEMTGLEDMSVEYIESVWGKPDAEQAAPKGKTLLFKDIHTKDSDPLLNKVEQKRCDIRLLIGPDDVVSSWTYENCRS